MCTLSTLLYYGFELYFLCLLAYALVSWVPSIRGGWSDALGRIIDPVLVPIRRMIPPIGGIDIAFLVLIVIVQVCARIAASNGCGAY